MHSDFRFAVPKDQYKGSKCWAGSSISSRISRSINLKLTFSTVFVCHIDVHIQSFSIHTKLSKTMAFEKSVLSIVAYGCCLTYLYRFYHSRATRTWSVYNKMYHNVFRYEYLTFQTQIHLHKQYIFDTNISQSEYAFLFPFSIWLNKCNVVGTIITEYQDGHSWSFRKQGSTVVNIWLATYRSDSDLHLNSSHRW